MYRRPSPGRRHTCWFFHPGWWCVWWLLYGGMSSCCVQSGTGGAFATLAKWAAIVSAWHASRDETRGIPQSLPHEKGLRPSPLRTGTVMLCLKICGTVSRSRTKLSALVNHWVNISLPCFRCFGWKPSRPASPYTSAMWWQHSLPPWVSNTKSSFMGCSHWLPSPLSLSLLPVSMKCCFQLDRRFYGQWWTSPLHRALNVLSFWLQVGENDGWFDPNSADLLLIAGRWFYRPGRVMLTAYNIPSWTRRMCNIVGRAWARHALTL